MSRKRILLFVALALLVAEAFWISWPSQGYDLARVEPRLRALKTPYQSVRTAYYMDFGSIGIEITDRDGKWEQFAFPVHHEKDGLHQDSYPKLFIGGLHLGSDDKPKPGMSEIKDPVPTRRMLVQILRAAPRRTFQDQICMTYLGDRKAADTGALLVRRFITEGAPPPPWARSASERAPFHSPAPPAAAP